MRSSSMVRRRVIIDRLVTRATRRSARSSRTDRPTNSRRFPLSLGIVCGWRATRKISTAPRAGERQRVAQRAPSLARRAPPRGRDGTGGRSQRHPDVAVAKSFNGCFMLGLLATGTLRRWFTTLPLPNRLTDEKSASRRVGARSAPATRTRERYRRGRSPPQAGAAERQGVKFLAWTPCSRISGATREKPRQSRLSFATLWVGSSHRRGRQHHQGRRRRAASNARDGREPLLRCRPLR